MAAPMEDTTPRTRLLNNPEDCLYTSCYCEENVWKLCEHISIHGTEELPKSYVVFISNPARIVPLWQQKLSNQDQPVVWDYHVILLHKREEMVQVYDLDSRLPFPCSFRQYMEQAILSEETMKPDYHRFFRVVPASDYLRHFASDRTHMLAEDGSWQKPPPPYPCLQTLESSNNIDDFISMELTVGWGTVMSHADLTQRFLSS